jgi:hypothetical protein
MSNEKLYLWLRQFHSLGLRVNFEVACGEVVYEWALLWEVIRGIDDALGVPGLTLSIL